MGKLRVQLRLVLPGGKTFGPGKAQLLDLIAEKGSIAAAGRAMKMSYKRAWSLVEEMNSAFDAPLVITGRGGADRGGAQVTDLGLRLRDRYRALVARVEGDGRQDIEFMQKSLRPEGQGLPRDAKSVMSD